ncbi:MAG: LysR family transcriptional regulator, partial [Micrococcaceae bacterium]|nr:LysR family transcriptional regulator [Micrococcaceae bacterium]
MKVIVLGGNGNLGRRVVGLLRESGHEAVSASTTSGVDAYTGIGLASTMQGADAVVDCLNLSSLNAGACIDFYDTTARNIIHAAER